MALDGTAGDYAQSGTSIAATLSTSAAGLIFAAVLVNGPSIGVSSVTATGLTFSKVAEQGVGDLNYVTLWVATSSGAQSSKVITANLSASSGFVTIHVFGYAGYSGLDANASNPDLGTTSPRTISTDSASTVVFGVARMENQANPTAGSGFTRILGGSGSGYLLTQYAEFSSTQSSLLVRDNGTTNDANGAIAIAYVAAGGGTTTRRYSLSLTGVG